MDYGINSFIVQRMTFLSQVPCDINSRKKFLTLHHDKPIKEDMNYRSSKNLRLCLVGGARPNFMKIAPLIRALNQRNAKNMMNAINYKLVHTGQH